MKNGIAKEDGGVRVLAPLRQPLGEPLDHPQGQPLQARRAAAAAALARPRGDVELELVNELVTEDVIGVGVDAGQRHYHPVAERFREAPDPFFDRSPVVVVCWKSAWSA